MKATILAIASFAAALSCAVAEPLSIESTFTETGSDGKARTLKLPAATVESGGEVVLNAASYFFKVTATLAGGTSVRLATIIEKTNASGKTEVISRPTILTMLGKAATISSGADTGSISLEQVVTRVK